MSRLDKALKVAQGIPGWMDTAELIWLGERASECKTIVEVGSWKGRSTKMLALMTDGVVWSIDDLTGEADDPDPELNTNFYVNLTPEVETGKVRVIRRPSTEAAKMIEKADMVFIDACHEYPAPKNDIEAWRPVVNGGLLCGHDAKYPGVEKSLEETLPGYSMAVGSIWVA